MAHTKLDIRVYPIDEPKSNTLAFASVAFNDLVAIRGIRVIDSEKGLFVSMPQSQDKKSGEYHDIAFPLNGDLRKTANEAVLTEYTKMASLAPEQRGYDKPDMKSANNINLEDIKLDIRIYPIKEPNGGTKAFASVSIDNIIAIRGIRVVEDEKGLITAMPQSKDNNGERHDIAFPLSGDLRKAINKAILDEYKISDKSLANGLRKGAEKAAQNNSVPREPTSKSNGLGVGGLG